MQLSPLIFRTHVLVTSICLWLPPCIIMLSSVVLTLSICIALLVYKTQLIHTLMALMFFINSLHSKVQHNEWC